MFTIINNRPSILDHLEPLEGGKGYLERDGEILVIY